MFLLYKLTGNSYKYFSTINSGNENILEGKNTNRTHHLFLLVPVFIFIIKDWHTTIIILIMLPCISKACNEGI